MLKVYFLIKDINTYRPYIEKIINVDMKRKYQICDINYISSFDDLLEREKVALDSSVYNVAVFKENCVSIDKAWQFVFSVFDLSLSCDTSSSEGKRASFTSLQQQLSQGLKKIKFVSALFQDKNQLAVMMLPKKNFISEILDNLFNELVQWSSNKNNQSLNRTQELLYNFVATHRQPKRRTQYASVKYFRDNDDLYFQLGDESHGKSETGEEHSSLCIFAAYFRFGIRLNRDKHFNVSKDGDNSPIPINTVFYSCHSQHYTVQSGTKHLNIFPNDYIR